jgi:hypothetical protein
MDDALFRTGMDAVGLFRTGMDAVGGMDVRVGGALTDVRVMVAVDVVDLAGEEGFCGVLLIFPYCDILQS